MHTTHLLVTASSVRAFHRNPSPPALHHLVPVCLHFLFAPWSSVGSNLPLRASYGGGQRQETVVSHHALPMKNSCPSGHHVILLKIRDPLLFVFLFLLCSLFVLCQTCIQLSASQGGGGAWLELSRWRARMIEIISIYLSVGASHESQTPTWSFILEISWTCWTNKVFSQQITVRSGHAKIKQKNLR